MQIIGTSRESDNISVFWEKLEENEHQIFVLKIVLGTLAYALEKRQIFHHSICLSELWRHSRFAITKINGMIPALLRRPSSIQVVLYSSQERNGNGF